MNVRITKNETGIIVLITIFTDSREEETTRLKLSNEAAELISDLLVVWKNRESLPGNVTDMWINDDGSFSMSGQLFEKGDPIIQQ